MHQEHAIDSFAHAGLERYELLPVRALNQRLAEPRHGFFQPGKELLPNHQRIVDFNALVSVPDLQLGEQFPDVRYHRSHGIPKRTRCPCTGVRFRNTGTTA